MAWRYDNLPNANRHNGNWSKVEGYIGDALGLFCGKFNARIRN
jgi:hypothetical protein